MKTSLLFIIAFSICTLNSFGQNPSNDGILDNKCFDQMIIRDITYAIFGESTPTSGIKVDLSKPEATITGIFNPGKSFLVGLEFKGEVVDQRFGILQGNSNWNSAFELKPSINWMPAWSSGMYLPSRKAIVKAQNQLLVDKSEMQNDTAKIMVLIYNKHLSNFPDAVDSKNILDLNTLTDNQLLILKSLIKEHCRKTEGDINGKSSKELINLIPAVQTDSEGKIILSSYNNKIVSDYSKAKKVQNNLDSELITGQIKNAEDAWTLKRYYWFTFTPFVRTEKVNQFYQRYQDIDSNYFESKHEFFYGLGTYFNFLLVKPEKVATYLKMGMNLSHASNISNINSFNYVIHDSLYSYGDAVTEKNKTGSAYNHSEYKTDFLGQIFLEGYILPLRSFVPGFYIATSLNCSGMYRLTGIAGREKDYVQFSLEGGPVFNINSKEKDQEKSILSVSVYCRFVDLTDKKRTTISTGQIETNSDYLKRNLSFGLKVGIPITLPKRK